MVERTMTMLKMIAAGVFTMFAVAGVASNGASAGTPQQCFPSYQACTTDCLDLLGSAKGVCLKICRAEYEECLAS